MRNLALGLVTVIALAGAPLQAEAGVVSYPKRVTTKLTHGLLDLVWSPLELVISPVTHMIDFDRHSRIGLYGAQVGLFVGAVKAEARFTRGFVDVFTCVFPSERYDHWDWEWTYGGNLKPLSQNTGIAVEDAR